MKQHVWETILFVMLLLLCSCRQHDLCFEHTQSYAIQTKFSYQLVWHENYDGYADIEDINLDWMDKMPMELAEISRSSEPTEPEGMRVIVLSDGERRAMYNVNPFGGAVSMEPGEYSLLFYNNDTENIIFSEDYSMAETMTATTRTRTRVTYRGNPYVEDDDEHTVSEPDVLFCKYVDSFSPEDFGYDNTMELDMRPVVFTYLVSFKFASGFEYVALARGALAGMAESVYLIDGTTTENTATILFDCNLSDNCVVAQVKSFGIPGYIPESGVNVEKTLVRDDGGQRSYGLTLEIRLKNGSLKTFNFDVTDQVALQPNGGVITVDGVEISAEDGKMGGSMFNVEVDDWGEYTDVTLPLGH
jgi:hypothetical protein